jgi:hypothetical protein
MEENESAREKAIPGRVSTLFFRPETGGSRRH